MRILSVSWDINDGRLLEATDRVSGYGQAVKNICDAISKRAEVFLFFGAFSVKKRDLDQMHIVGTEEWLSFERNESNIDEWHNALKLAFSVTLDELKPDIILFHGAEEFTYNCINICVGRKQKYAVILHGYTGRNHTVLKINNWEEKVIGLSYPNMIAVSEGVRKQVKNDWPQIDTNEVTVIRNGTEMYRKEFASDYREKYNCRDKSILVCVGSFQPNKNQKQIVSAVFELPKVYRERIKVLFCGKDTRKYPYLDEVKKLISEMELEDYFGFMGVLSRENMEKMYYTCDGLIQPSFTEGLSLTALEALAYGKPVIMFKDNPSSLDLDNREAVICIEERSDQGLAKGIIEWLDKTWCEEKIIDYSREFSISKCADQYIAYCMKRIGS